MGKQYLLLVSSFLFWGLIAFFLVALSINNQPSITDEFCFAWTGRDFGIFKGAYLYYTNWSGRYFTNILFHLNPLIFSENFQFFSIVPILLLFVGFFNGTWFIKNLMELELKNSKLWVISFAFQGLCLYLIPGFYQVFFWNPALFYYLSFHLVICLVNLYFFEVNLKGKSIILYLLLICIIGTSEITMLYSSAILWAYLFLKVIGREVKMKQLVFGLIALALMAVVILAPGNAIRAGNQAKIWPLIFSNTWKFSFQSIRYFFSQPLVYAWFSLLLGFSPYAKKWLEKITFFQIGFISFAFVIAYFAGFLALCIGLNESDMPLRVLSLIQLFVLLFTSFLVLYFAPYFLKRSPIFYKIDLQIAGLFCMICFGIFSPNFKLLFREWRSGKQVEYAKENAARFQKIKDSKDSVVAVEPIQSNGTMFFTEELSTDSTHLWCKCIAHYYHKKAVYLKK